MGDLLLIATGAALVNNFVLVRFLGLCPVLGASSRLDNALGLSLATTLVLTLSSGLTWILDYWLLIPLDLGYLRILGFILVIAGTVQATELVLRHSSTILHQRLGVYLPLITSNCAVLGVALINTGRMSSLVEALVFGLAAGLGFCLVMISFSGLRERLAAADVPLHFRGVPIALVTASLMSLAFLGFAGLSQS
ncbi:MAG: electron transport complex subunit RsxA [Chromatiales bacterium]|nr:electron transport complex subunit RsxA [Chromatiales bacterium]